MGLNIKNPALEAEIRALASETGEGLTEALAVAVRERRSRLARAGAKPDRRAALAEIVRSVRLPDEFRTSSHDDLYDAFGLPK